MMPQVEITHAQGPIQHKPAKKEPPKGFIRFLAVLASPFTKAVQSIKSWNFVRKLEKEGKYDDVLRRLGLSQVKKSKFADALFEKAQSLGYKDTPTHGMRALSLIRDLWSSSDSDKLVAIDLIASQLSASDIQVKALRTLFSKVPEKDLTDAVKQHYEAIPQETKPLEIRIPIGSSGLHKFFFKNEDDVLEVALVHIRPTTAQGNFKIYRLAGTMAQVQDVACLDLETKETKEVEKETLTRELKYWQVQMDAKVRHIPALYYRTERSIYCENLAGGDGVDYINEATPEEQEQFFRNAGLVILEYLEDIEKLHLVHRDLKPENLLVGKDPSDIRVTDFGFMAHIDEKRDGQGTPDYYAPEIRWDPKLHIRQDIYSAARTLESIRYLEQDAIVAKAEGNRDGFDKLVFRMMSDDPTNRPTVSEALTEWREFMKA